MLKQCMKVYIYIYLHFTDGWYKKYEETRAVTDETRQQKRKNISRGMSAVQSGTKSMGLAMTSEIVTRSYITGLLNFSQGQCVERRKEITCLLPSQDTGLSVFRPLGTCSSEVERYSSEEPKTISLTQEQSLFNQIPLESKHLFELFKD